MISVLICFIAFFLSIILHIRFCRFSPIKNLKSKLFLQISLSTLFIYINISLFLQLPYIGACTIIYLLMIPAYLVVYVTTVLVSPSKKILMCLSQSNGITYDEILRFLKQENLVLSRLDELVQSGCVYTRDGRHYQLSSSGKSLSVFLDLFGKLLGRGIGG